MKKLIALLGVAICLGLIAYLSLYFPAVQDQLMKRGMAAVLNAPTPAQEDALHVFICGSSSPLPAPNRAQACIAVLTPKHFYIIDSGAGSTANIQAARLPMSRLEGVLLTHFHSDHISELYELNLASWVAGRTQPLSILGPTGVEQVVQGINLTYAQDVGYRVAHHGAEMLPPALGVLVANTFSPGIIIDQGDLVIEALTVDHTPVSPAVAFKISYKDRTVLITGDTVMTPELASAANDIDLLLTDALSMPILTTMADTAEQHGALRNAKILRDVMDYHAHTDAIDTVAQGAKVNTVGYYHMVPAPSNLIMQRMYERTLPDNTVLTEDGMWFVLRPNDNQVVIE